MSTHPCNILKYIERSDLTLRISSDE